MRGGINVHWWLGSSGAAVVNPGEGETGYEDGSEHHAPDGEALRVVRGWFGDVGGDVDGWPVPGLKGELFGSDWG